MVGLALLLEPLALVPLLHPYEVLVLCGCGPMSSPAERHFLVMLGLVLRGGCLLMDSFSKSTSAVTAPNDWLACP